MDRACQVMNTVAWIRTFGPRPCLLGTCWKYRLETDKYLNRFSEGCAVAAFQ